MALHTLGVRDGRIHPFAHPWRVSGRADDQRSHEATAVAARSSSRATGALTRHAVACNVEAMVVPVTERMRDHRARLRAEGFRPVQLWLPDTRQPEFLAQARRESLLANRTVDHDETMAWLDYLNEDAIVS